MKISIIIITRNRASFLNRCLASVVSQTVSPQEIIVVDNDSTDHTRSVIAEYKKMLPIRSIRKHRIGIPHARNAGIMIAHGDIVAFLDDDCTAYTKWISSIEKFFKTYPLAVGVIGNTSAANDKSITALIEAAFNYRWILMHVDNPKIVCQIQSGVIVDFKNAAFRLAFIKQFQFSSHTPYGDAGSNEDAEIGFRMFQKNQNIFYDSSIMALHHYSATLSRLLWRNFWGGYGDKLLLFQNRIDLRKTNSTQRLNVWISLCLQVSKHLPLLQRVIFFLLIFIYPLASRIGRMVATITWRLNIPISIPQR